MKRLALLLGTLALAPWFHSRALAQAIQNPLQVRRAGEQIEYTAAIYGTIADCEQNVEFEFGMDFGGTVPIWEAWVGVGNTNCAQVESRRVTSTTTNAQPVCKLLGTDKEATAKPRIKVRAREMFSKDWNATQCDEVRNQLYTVYLLPLTQETNRGSNTASEPTTIAGQSTKTATFTLYTLPPNPPGNLREVTGESQLGVKFDVQSGAVAKTQYRAYFDWGTGGPGECGSGVLDPPGTDAGAGDMDAGVAETDAGDEDAGTDEEGMDAGAEETDAGEDYTDAGEEEVVLGTRPPPAGTPNVASETVGTGEAYLKDPGGRGIEVGDLVAVSVVQVDPAGNESALSAPICVERVETFGFLDNCKNDPKCKDGFTECSLSAGQKRGGFLGLGALIGLGSALALRRRRRV